MSGCIQQADILTGVGHPKQMSYFVYFYFLQENNGKKEEVSEEANRGTQQEWRMFWLQLQVTLATLEIPGMLSPTALAHNKA